MIKFRVRMTRIATKGIEVIASAPSPGSSEKRSGDSFELFANYLIDI